MTDHDALLAAIISEPADDTPRLAYADWLQENEFTWACSACHGDGWVYFGGVDGIPQEKRNCVHPRCRSGRVSSAGLERAEFIRVQVELAQLDSGDRCYVCGWPYKADGGCEPGNCSYRPEPHNAEYDRWQKRQTHYHGLRSRERDYLSRFGKVWSILLTCKSTRPDGTEYTYWFPPGDQVFTRGFVSGLAIDWKRWRQHADAITRAQPIERVRFTDRPLVNEDELYMLNENGTWKSRRWPGIEFELPAEGDRYDNPLANPAGLSIAEQERIALEELGRNRRGPWRSPPIPGDTGADEFRR